MSWTLLESQILSGSQASITLGNGGTLNQGYKTLRILICARTDRASVVDANAIRPNAATTNLSTRNIQGNGSTAGSGTDTVIYGGLTTAANATASTFGNSEVILPNYTGSTHKPVSADGVSENNATTAIQDLDAGLWSNTAAITSIQIVPYAGTNFLTGSSFTLYGLK